MRSLVDRLIDRGVILLVCLSVLGHSSPTAQEASPRFHHLHLNSTDPAAAIEWYTKTFPVTSRAAVAGYDGIASEQVHLLFNHTSTPPRATLDSAIWHFGWGSPDMPGDYAMHQQNGVKFATPMNTSPSRNRVRLHERTRRRAGRDQFRANPRLRARSSL